MIRNCRETETFALRDALSNAAFELGQLAVMAQGVDDGLGAALVETTAPSPKVIAALQKVDALRQSLEAMSQFIEQTAVQVSTHSTIDPNKAVSGLTLHDLARALTTVRHTGVRPVSANTQAPGDASFF